MAEGLPPNDRDDTEPPAPPAIEPATRRGRFIDWVDLLRNRFILAGLGSLVVLLLIAVVLLALGRSDDDLAPAAALDDATPENDATPVSRDGLAGLVLTTATVRSGPGGAYSPLGTVPDGARVDLVGRNADEAWLQITFPPGSRLVGWVRASVLDVNGDVSRLAVAGPSEPPAVAVPTSPPIIVQPQPTAPIVILPTSTPIPQEPTSTPTTQHTSTAAPPTRTPTPIATAPPTPTTGSVGPATPTSEGGSSQPVATPTSGAFGGS